MIFIGIELITCHGKRKQHTRSVIGEDMENIGHETKRRSTPHKKNLSLERDSLHLSGRNWLICFDIFSSSLADARLRLVGVEKAKKKWCAGKKKKGARERPVSVTGQT